MDNQTTQEPCRLPFPAALADPAFQRCAFEAIAIPEFVDNFDRLSGSCLGRVLKVSPIERMVDEATGFRDEQFRKFLEFVHFALYTRLPDKDFAALRRETSPQFEEQGG